MNKITSNWKKTILFLILILFACAALRFLRIGVGGQPVFTDEAIYIRWAQVMKAEPTLRFLPLSDGKQPLFMWVLMFLLRPGIDPLLIGRGLSVATGFLSNLGIFILSFILFKSKKTALFASFIYALMPMTNLFDSMALVDSMLSMFGIWIFIFATLAVRKYRFDFSMLSGFSLGGALLTKSPALFYSLLLPITGIFGFGKIKSVFNLKKIIKIAALFIPIYLIGYAMYNILRLGPNFHLIATRNSDYIFPLSHILENPADPFFNHLRDVINWFWLIGPWSFIFMFLLGTIYGVKNHFKEAFLLLALSLIPIFTNSMYAKVFTVRYILFSVPFLIIISGLSINMVKKIKLQLLLIGLFAVTSLYVDKKLIFNIEASPLPKSERTGYLENWTAGYGIKETAVYLINYQKIHPDEKIIVGTEGYFGTLPDGLQMYLADYPMITIVGVGIDIVELPSELRESRDFGSTTFFVINSSRLLGKPEDLGLELVASYPKPLRTIGTHEQVRYGLQDTLYFFKVKKASAK